MHGSCEMPGTTPKPMDGGHRANGGGVLPRICAAAAGRTAPHGPVVEMPASSTTFLVMSTIAHAAVAWRSRHRTVA
jgi:hypothetical protein